MSELSLTELLQQIEFIIEGETSFDVLKQSIGFHIKDEDIIEACRFSEIFTIIDRKIIINSIPRYTIIIRDIDNTIHINDIKNLLNEVNDTTDDINKEIIDMNHDINNTYFIKFRSEDICMKLCIILQQTKSPFYEGNIKCCIKQEHRKSRVSCCSGGNLSNSSRRGSIISNTNTPQHHPKSMPQTPRLSYHTSCPDTPNNGISRKSQRNFWASNFSNAGSKPSSRRNSMYSNVSRRNSSYEDNNNNSIPQSPYIKRSSVMFINQFEQYNIDNIKKICNNIKVNECPKGFLKFQADRPRDGNNIILERPMQRFAKSQWGGA